MAGTMDGGFAAAATNRKKYGPDFYARIGAIGGARGHTGGFAAGSEGRERARLYGAIGGRLSKRGGNREPETPEQLQARAVVEAARAQEKAAAARLRDLKLLKRLKALQAKQADIKVRIERLQAQKGNG